MTDFISATAGPMRGPAGETFQQGARRTGAYNAQPADSDVTVMAKFGQAVLDENPAFRGPPGDAPFTNLRDYNADPDGATDASPALGAALQAGATLIVMPSNTGSHVEYRFNDSLPINGLIGRTVDVDPVATLSQPNDIILNAAGGLIQWARRTKHFFRSLGRAYWSLPDGNLTPMEKSIFLGDGQPDFSRFTSVQANDGVSLKPSKILWNTGNTWEDDTFSGATASSYSFAPSATDGYFHAGMKRMQPGQRYFARPTVTGAPILVAQIRHSGGYVGIMGATNASNSLDLVVKNLNSAGTSTATSFFSTTHASYTPKNSVWSIDVESWNVCSVLLNGVVVGRFTTAGIISHAGFGMFALNAGDAVTWDKLTIGADLPHSAGRLLSIVAFGDSRLAPRDASPINYLRNALDLSFGTRVTTIDNKAIGGQNSTQQRAACDATDLSKYNIALIAPGTNDAKDGIPVATTIANLDAMATRAKTAGATPVFVIFPLWYGQAQAPGGQNSGNYDQTADHRAAILRFCADNGYKVLDLSSMTGPVLAQYVNPNLDFSLVGLGDPVLFDNIHYTALFNKIYGCALARMIAGTFFSKPTLYLGPQGIAAANGWSAGGGTEVPIYSVSASGYVEGLGLLMKPSAGIVEGSLMAVLPPHLWTGRTHRFKAVASEDNEAGRVEYNGANGELRAYGFSTSDWIDLTFLRFQLPRA